ncbi:MAG: TIGR04076 family protein [Candidatus Thorarchaeota archaeon]
MVSKLKVTVIRKFTPEDVFGPNHGITYNGGEIPSCPLELGQEFIVDDHRDRPEGFCGRAWHDLYTTLMAFYYGGDMEWPAPGVTYQPCGDGVKPVVFRIEKIID